jgi:hypothetical protein
LRALLGMLMAVLLAGCAPGAMIDKLPDAVGLPAGAPARPAQAADYPAVHDMPPPRADPALSTEQQVNVEKELNAARDAQEERLKAEPEPPAAPTAHAKQPAKKPAKKPAKGENTGAKTNP